jgi:hypothetical protein
VPPARPLNAPDMPPRWQGILWGTLPFGSSLLAILVVLIPGRKYEYVEGDAAFAGQRDLEPGRLVS